MERCWPHRLRAESGCAAILTIFCVYVGGSTPIDAQGITTAAIGGTVRAENGEVVEGAAVRVVNLATGYVTETPVRRGAFVVQGLPTGGPYRVVVRSLGYSPEVLDGLSLALGERRDVSFTLISLATQLDTVKVRANDAASRPPGGGVGMSISDSALRRLPTLNRDLYDLIRLVPQVSTRQGISGAGANYRFNSYVIDGVSDRQLQGNNVLGGAVGGKSISLDAIKEFQVLLSPYEPRYGDFAGVLVNAVTKSGTNEVHGSAYGYVRNEQLARASSFVGSSPYRREQFGFSLGGPIMRNRIHFFIAPEFQHSEAPTTGPYVGQGPDALPALPVAPADVTRFASLLRDKGLAAGDGGRVMSLNPAVTVFGRLDIALPEWRSRAVFLNTYSTVDVTRFTRSSLLTFPLSSNAWTLQTAKRSTSVQLFTQASPSAFNELVFAYMDRPIGTIQRVHSPSVQASVVAADGVGTAALIAGPPTAAGGSGSVSVIGEVADHLVWQAGPRHTLGAGIHIELFVYHAQGVRGSLGQWRFSSLDSLFNGDASNYSITKDFGSSQARVRGAQPSAYFSDEWSISDRLSLTLGLRADVLKFSGHPAYNAAVDSVFQRRTSDYPRVTAQWSPRFGFRWQPFADDRTRIRGGAGIFVGPPPLGWLVGPMRADGAGVRTLTCTGQFGLRKVPMFVADASLQPLACPDGRGFSDGPVALVDRNLKMAESFRTSIAVERRLPWRLNATAEALYTRVRSDFLFVNANLGEPQGVGAHGRVLYGTFDAFGRVISGANIGGRRFTEAIDLRNHSLGHSWSLTAQLDRPFSDRFEVRASYTHSLTRDVQSLTNFSAVTTFDIWASGRPISGRHDDLSTGVSSFEIPHRVVLAASYVAPWKRWKTDISLYYVGESGTPFTYGDSTANGLGDLNADGTSANDPIYVPLNALDAAEIKFSGVSDAPGADNLLAAQADRERVQQNAFEQFIRATPCLRRQRGMIVSRNSCRGPWVNTSNASVRQSLQAVHGHDVSLQIEAFNVLNLLNPSWGLFRVPNDKLLQQVGQTFGASAQPVFRFDPANADTSTQNLESGYQLQLSLRYSF